MPKLNRLSRMIDGMKPAEVTIISDPDEELTLALERVQRVHGSDLASFFEFIRNKENNQCSLFDLDETENIYPTAALVRYMNR